MRNIIFLLNGYVIGCHGSISSFRVSASILSLQLSVSILSLQLCFQCSFAGGSFHLFFDRIGFFIPKSVFTVGILYVAGLRNFVK